MVKRNAKKRVLRRMASVVGQKRKAVVQRTRAKMNLAKRKRVQSVDLGPTLPVRASTSVRTATEGYICPPHYQSIGKKRIINKMVKFMYPSHRLVYRKSGVTSYVDNEQAVTLFKTNECADLNDALTSLTALVYDVQGQGLPGNVNAENSGTTAADPANVRIGGYLNKMYLESHYTKLRLTSNIEIGQKVEVLPILAKKNVPRNQANASTYDSTVVDPLKYWQQLMTQQVISGVTGASPTQASVNTVNRLGSRPYDKEYRSDFERWFKCLTPARFVLQAGQQTTFGMMQHVYKELKMADIFDCVGIEGITMYYMVFTEATLVGNGNAVGIQVNTGATSCLYMLEQTRTIRLTSFSRGHTLTVQNDLTQIARNDQTFVDNSNGEVEIGTAMAEI